MSSHAHRAASAGWEPDRPRRRSVTSLFSNLVTRPTGRAIRTGIESQIAEIDPAGAAICISIIDFSQVRVLDYSCADEAVAKLLLRFQGDERPAEAYFVVRGMHEHHIEPVQEVLERHRLLLAASAEDGGCLLLGSANAAERAVWEALVRLERASAARVSEHTGLHADVVGSVAARLCRARVVAAHQDGTLTPLPLLLRGEDS